MAHSSLSLNIASRIMSAFARDTGLADDSLQPKRYLWTDAFAVCNFLELFEQTGDEEFQVLALRLVDQVHWVLGRHREDDSRRGWISGLGEAQGRSHPTRGGLRIGKKLPEREPEEALDERQEWDRDGQYFHYLTRWMHALYRTWRVIGDDRHLVWAMELAQTACDRFTYRFPPNENPYLVWKMSIDLSRPLLRSMGHHDPLDGWIACLQLQRAAGQAAVAAVDLRSEIDRLGLMCRGSSWATGDPLGLGGLLCDAYRLAQMLAAGEGRGRVLLQEMLAAAVQGLGVYAETGPAALPANYRLAFRELGLGIGLKGVARLRRLVERELRWVDKDRVLQALVREVEAHAQAAESIENFWLQKQHRQAPSWVEHRDINRVMLATCLVPQGYLKL